MPRKLDNNTLVIASHNEGKIAEISMMLLSCNINCPSARSLCLPEPDENGHNYLENALLKAKACVEKTNLPSLGDDSGLEVEALGGEPGLFTAPYTKEMGGQEQVFALWGANKNIRENPTANFICIQVLLWPDGHYEHFSAVVPGFLEFPPRGNYGHGYDPIFVPQGEKRTMAEIALEERRFYSHRLKALQALIAGCINKI